MRQHFISQDTLPAVDEQRERAQRYAYDHVSPVPYDDFFIETWTPIRIIPHSRSGRCRKPVALCRRRFLSEISKGLKNGFLLFR